MVKAAVREECIQVGWVDTVNELCENLSETMSPRLPLHIAESYCLT